MAEAIGSDIRTNYVEWGPVLAGAVAASAISFVLFTAGSAIGLSLLSPYPNQSYGKSAATLAAFWAIVVPILSLLVGGYLAGRMRAAWSINPDEREFRDGVHGLLVWSTAVVIGGLLAYLAAGTAAQVGGEIGKAAIADRGALVATSIDTMLRPTPGPAQNPAPQQAADNRDELTRIFVASTADGTLSAADKDYLAQVVSAQTGLPPDVAQKRVDDAYASALEAVDNARQAAVAAGLATATALLVSLAAAWYAAQRGGHHRDQNIPARFTSLPPRSTRT
ncbi:hypothetical protein [Hyphomicrobium sp.]|uniref:hypothetical protein n=1 Tax=Hyphomicrobium sp. TaxID=82 RepID=UPI002E2F560C|nr:hypothetical protein [Hyphomicrobium sp.]HEX2841368.1 hypothetical protein [Hyphomicrobium sp.]